MPGVKIPVPTACHTGRWMKILDPAKATPAVIIMSEGEHQNDCLPNSAKSLTCRDLNELWCRAIIRLLPRSGWLLFVLASDVAMNSGNDDDSNFVFKMVKLCEGAVSAGTRPRVWLSANSTLHIK